jgi:hypothetical protein
MSALAEQLTDVGFLPSEGGTTSIIPARDTALTKTEIDDILSLQEYASEYTARRITELIREMVENSCAPQNSASKTKYFSYAQADEGRNEFLRRFPNDFSGRPHQKVVYRCPFCDHYHFGNAPSAQRLAKERELVDLAARVRADLDRETTTKQVAKEEQNLLSKFKIAKQRLTDLETDYNQKRDELMNELAAIRDKIQAEVDLPLPSVAAPPTAPKQTHHRTGRPQGFVPISDELVDRLKSLTELGVSRNKMAEILNSEGFRTVTGLEFTGQTIKSTQERAGLL